MEDVNGGMVFCTLFDSNYLDKGLALYWSMRKHMDIFKLYIFAFDSRSYGILRDMRLRNVVVLSLEDIMTADLRRLQKERTPAEFCWTCTPVIVEYVLLKHRENVCTYIDADIFFFADPEPAVRRIVNSGCSVGLVEHRFEKDYEYGQFMFEFGKYCIQFNTFLNTREGLQVLNDWKRDCLEWCYARNEDEKYGDQKYPDKWGQRYSCVYENPDPGLGVAPWNLHLYSCIREKDGEKWVDYEGVWSRLVFYHFQGMKCFPDGEVCLMIWRPEKWGMGRKVRLLYGEYFRRIGLIRDFLHEKYGVTFEQLFINKNSFPGREYSLSCLCGRNGLLDGTKKWMGHRANNLVSADKWMKGRR